MSPQIIPMSHPNKISNIIWDSDLQAPAPYKINANCLKEITTSSDNIVDISKIGYRYNPNCRHNSNSSQACNDLINMGNITDFDNFYISIGNKTNVISCKNNIIKTFVNELSDNTVLKVSLGIPLNDTLPYNYIFYSYCIDGYYADNFSMLSNINYTNHILSGTLLVSQFKEMIKRSHNHVIIGPNVANHITPTYITSIKFEVLNQSQVSMLREQPQALSRVEYNTLHNIVDEDTQTIAQK